MQSDVFHWDISERFFYFIMEEGNCDCYCDLSPPTSGQGCQTKWRFAAESRQRPEWDFFGTLRRFPLRSDPSALPSGQLAFRVHGAKDAKDAELQRCTDERFFLFLQPNLSSWSGGSTRSSSLIWGSKTWEKCRCRFFAARLAKPLMGRTSNPRAFDGALLKRVKRPRTCQKTPSPC